MKPDLSRSPQNHLNFKISKNIRINKQKIKVVRTLISSLPPHSRKILIDKSYRDEDAVSASGTDGGPRSAGLTIIS